jgi:KDO2-lipid IV(A) lauroyltransferase
MVQDAYRCAWRVHLEELLLGKVGPHNVCDWIDFEGTENLDEALSWGKGVVWAYPHAGAVMMMMAWLSHRGYPYTQYAARGLAPVEVAKDHPELLASNRWREKVRAIRESNEDRLPARFLTHEDSARELYRRLAANELVGIAYDGRIGRRWACFDYLGRQALLNSGPYRLAAATGAAIVPAFCTTPAGEPARCLVGKPIRVDRKDWRSGAEQVLAAQESWIRRHPEEYGIWLLHARIRNDIDDHPLFTDHAIDERWKRWISNP